MVVIGKTDLFEHTYTEKFRAFAAQFGQFVSYERDIATRDLGLHLTRTFEEWRCGGHELPLLVSAERYHAQYSANGGG